MGKYYTIKEYKEYFTTKNGKKAFITKNRVMLKRYKKLKYKKTNRLSVEDQEIEIQRDLRKILWKYYIEHKKIKTIKRETGFFYSYILQIVKGKRYPEQVNKYLLEIKKRLDNQQPNLLQGGSTTIICLSYFQDNGIV